MYAKYQEMFSLGIFPALKVMVKLIQIIFVHVCCIFPCCIFCVFFCVVLKALQYLRNILLVSVEKIFGETIKKLFIGVGQLELIHYPVIFLCLFRNYLIVSKLNCLLLFLLLLLIFILHKWYFPIRFSIVFHFHCCFIVK